MLSYRTILSLLCLLIHMLSGRAQANLIDHLLEHRSLSLEWKRQLCGTGAQIERRHEVPLFADEFYPGEEEFSTRMLLELVDENEVIISFRYAGWIKASAGSTEIVNTRFRPRFSGAMRAWLEAVNETQLSLTLNQLIEGDTLAKGWNLWEKKIGEIVEPRAPDYEMTIPTGFLSAGEIAGTLQTLLEKGVWTSSVNYRTLATARSKDRVVHDYYRLIHPSQTTLLGGIVDHPIDSVVRVKYFLEGSWIRAWRDTSLLLDESGGFQLELQLTRPKMISFSHGTSYLRLYLEPGDTLQLTTDADAFYRSLTFSGAKMNENSFLRDFYRAMRNDQYFHEYDEKLTLRQPMKYLAEQLEQEEREQAYLKQYHKALSLSFHQTWRRHTQLEYANLIWEAGKRFSYASPVPLDEAYTAHCRELGKLLLTLTQIRSFDFWVEEYIELQYALLSKLLSSSRITASERYHLGKSLLPAETAFRHGRVILMRDFLEDLAFSTSTEAVFNDMQELCLDEELLRELDEYKQKGILIYQPQSWSVLPRRQIAPGWSFPDAQGNHWNLSDLRGRHVLLHLGEVDRLDAALSDLAAIGNFPSDLQVIHLVFAEDFPQFQRRVRAKSGKFLFVGPQEASKLKQDYRIADAANSYVLLGPDATVLSSAFELNTPVKIKNRLEEIERKSEDAKLLVEDRLRFWQWLAGFAGLLVLVSAIHLWRRHVVEKTERRRRRLVDLELRTIRAQLNPHFLFNALNSIQFLIRKNDQR